MAEVRPGSHLGQYLIREQIGQGGMATIFRARQETLGRDVAIKVLPAYLAADPEYLARFRREATAIAQLQHPNILPVYDFGEQDGQTYIVMLLVPGGQTLRERLGAPLPFATILRLITQVGSALQYAHEQGIVHRDVKPSNILLGERDWALLSDFGIARMLQGSTHLTRTGVGIGTPEYMSPEQGQGAPVDGRADQYSLAVILYQMLTGKLPFVAETPVATVIQHITKPVPPPREINPALPPAVEAVVLMALSKDPNERYPSVSAFVDALTLALPGSRSSPGRTPAPVTPPPREATVPPAAGAAVSPAIPAPASASADVATERAVAPPRRRRWLAASLAGAFLCAGVALGTGALGLNALGGRIGQLGGRAGQLASAPSPTPTLLATLTPARPPAVLPSTDAEPTATPTVTSTEPPPPSPTEAPPSPTATHPPPRPTATPSTPSLL
ncbi:MAG: protein kinase [Chloroflexi bacterium]|nr:protein kinase [Chloroflexota bacterium]